MIDQCMISSLFSDKCREVSIIENVESCSDHGPICKRFDMYVKCCNNKVPMERYAK